MELAVHMRNNKTGEKRIKKTEGKDASMGNWSCKDFYYGSEWSWTGTEAWENVADEVEHIGRGYYKRKVHNMAYKEKSKVLIKEGVGIVLNNQNATITEVMKNVGFYYKNETGEVNFCNTMYETLNFEPIFE